MESYAGMVGETLEDLAPEERHQIYKLLRLDVASDRTGLWRSQASLLRWNKRQRRVRRIANFRHLAYKGFVDTRREGEIDGVR